jgi:branched-chain amino acid aminotransferase
MILQRRAAAAGGSDAIVLAADGSIAEAAMSNLFTVLNGRVMTPPLSSGCLPGITRHTVLACCETLALPAAETRLTIDDLRAADELFLTSAVRRIQPVSALAPREFPDAPGPITARLTEALHAMIDRKSVQL